VTVLLADVCTITMGQAPPGTSYNDREEGLPLLAGAGDFRGSRIAPSKFTTQPKKSSAEGDIILSIRASIGAKVWADREYCLGRGVAGLRPGPQLSARYLWHWLSHSERALAAKGRGATFLQVNRSDIGEMPIDLPSLDEQRRIAAILDRADAVRAKRRQVLAHLDSLTQSIFHSMFGAILDRTTLGEVFEVSTGSTPSRKDPGNYGGSTPWVKTAEVHGVITETEEHVTSNGISAARLRLFPAGSVLIAMYGQGRTRGSSAVLGIDATTNQACAVLLPSEVMLSSFVAAQLRIGYERLRASARGGNQANLNLSLVRKFEIVQAPLSQQRAFAARIASVEQQRSAQQRALAADDELFASLQSRAFRGEL